ncbi:pyridoxamine 5'-phosphate oxidase family protein [Pseudonocardia spirodelae]|uniref:Pyridoxamine 5'-phosphate oxidase family protein n=1 Tax=Pseudonocardia spirodelae TaxID=3133431 RepID=A0ABU8TCI4_9PSEU
MDTHDTTRETLTAADRELLARPLHGFLTGAGGPVPAQPRPVWVEATEDGAVQLFTGPESLHVRRHRRDARATVVVAAPAGEPERWVSVTGPTTVETDGAHALARRLAGRYWDLGDPVRAGQLAEILAGDQVRLVIHPQRVRRFSF